MKLNLNLIPMNLLPRTATVLLRSIQGRSWAAATVASLAGTKWAGAVVNDSREGLVLWMNESEVRAVKLNS